MNYRLIANILPLAILIFSCAVKPSEGTDENTGGHYKGDGLDCESINIEINDTVDNRNEFIYGEKVRFIFHDVDGFRSDAGQVSPSITMNIFDVNTDSIVLNIEETDLHFEDNETISLFADFLAAFPHRNDEQYKAEIKIQDQKGDGTFTYDCNFSVKASDLLDIRAKGITYNQIYLWNQTQEVAALKDIVKSQDEHFIIFEGLRGFEELDEKVFPKLSIELYDGNDSLIVESENALASYTQSGIPAKDIANNQIYATLQFGKDIYVNPCKIVCRLEDSISDKEILVQTELIVIE